MKKFLFLFFLFSFICFSSEWYEKNKNILVVFPDYIKNYLKKADEFDTKGMTSYADYYLRLTETKIQSVLPFSPSNWPNGWPQDREAMKYLKYATPDAYLYRIIGDYALSHNKNKEGIKYLQMYLSKCIIPDTTYMMKLATIYQKENMLRNAEGIYEEVRNVVETKNFFGEKYSVSYLTSKIKNIQLLLKNTNILTLNVSYNNVPDFLKSDFQNLFLVTFKEEVKNINLITNEQLKKVLEEENITEEDIGDEEDLSYVAKILNADYVIKPLLSKIESQYIFEINVFDPKKKIFFENYEFKADDIRFLPNIIERFCYKFQEKDIPGFLYIPENQLIWSFEADSLISDIKISDDGKRTILGTEGGCVYILSDKGNIIRKLSFPEKIVKVAVSPDGQYFSFYCLGGNIYFLNKYGTVLWNKKLNNYGRGIDISKDGRFLVIGVNNNVYYVDNNGEIFWDLEVSKNIDIIKISSDAHWVFAGLENGVVCCFSDDGNERWRKNVEGKIEDIKITTDTNFICISTKKGQIYLFNRDGTLIKKFFSDEDIDFAIFSPSVLDILSGKKGNYFYFLSYDKKGLWKYQLQEKIDFAVGLVDGKLVQTVEKNNVFSFSIKWR